MHSKHRNHNKVVSFDTSLKPSLHQTSKLKHSTLSKNEMSSTSNEQKTKTKQTKKPNKKPEETNQSVFFKNKTFGSKRLFLVSFRAQDYWLHSCLVWIFFHCFIVVQILYHKSTRILYIHDSHLNLHIYLLDGALEELKCSPRIFC